MIFYDFSGGMESAAMLVLERDRINFNSACVRYADTGKQFPEAEPSRRQIQDCLGIHITVVPQRITFEQFLFERGGIIRKGTTDCSRRMKRGNLSRHMKTFERPYEVNLGFNAGEQDRADDFVARNERTWLHWRFPLIEHGITREETWEICRTAGFTILVGMYEKMGRFDCYFCGNQKPSQALLVAKHYPELATEWIDYEDRKGHSFMPLPLKILIDRPQSCEAIAESKCGCYGGTDDFSEDEDDELVSARVEGGGN